MKRKITSLKKGMKWCVSLLILLTIACKKDENNPEYTGPGLPADLQGTLYWYFAGDVGYQNFGTGRFVDHMMDMGNGTSLFDSFDISWDNKNILITLDVEGTFNFHQRRFVLRKNTDGIQYGDLSDGTNLFDHVYEWDDIDFTYAYISPNGKYLALGAQLFSDLPVTILNAETGKRVSYWYVEGVSFSRYGTPIWTADNSLYFRIANKIYVCRPSNGYASAPLVLTLPEGSSYFNINPQGTKVVYRYKKHLWMCNIDGSDTRQITTCETSNILDYDGENSPIFSPDGKYIAFTGATKKGLPWSYHNEADGSWVAGTGGTFGYIVIIPADGKLYDLDNTKGGAVWLNEPGKASGVTSSHTLIWR